MAQAKNINRSNYGQYGLTTIDGFEVPYLSAEVADRLATPGEKWVDASHSRGGYIRDLGWSGNSFSNALARGAAAFGLEKRAVEMPGTSSDGQYGQFDYLGAGYTGIPSEPVSGYQVIGDLQGLAQKFNIDTSNLQPYEKEVTGTVYGTGFYGDREQQGTGVIQVPVRDMWGDLTGTRPLTRTVSVEEQLYDKINEATKDFYSYTGDTLIPGQASEGSPNSFQTVLYKKEGDVLKPITAPVSHGGWQNADVYTGGSGFKLSELLRGVAPVAAFAIGAPFLDAALAAGAAGAGAAGGAGAGGSYAGINLGGAFVPTAGSGASFALPAAAGAGAAGGLDAYMSAAGLNPGAFTGANFTLPAGAGGSIGGIDLGGAFTPTPGSGASFNLPSALPTTVSSELMGPTYQELGYTGLEAGQMGPTYGELGYTGLNNAEAIAAADAAAKGFSAKNLLSGANQANKLAKLLTQGGSQGGSQVGRSMTAGNAPFGVQMAQQPMLEQFGGLYRMNENPFNFGTQGQSVATPGMYDVSGSNPMANALRKS